MNSKTFIRQLTAYLKTHSPHPDAVCQKNAVLFQQNGETYGEISFSDMGRDDSISLFCCVYNAEIGGYIVQTMSPYMRTNEPDEFNLIFQQDAINFIAKLPDTPNQAEPFCADIARYIKEQCLPVILAVHQAAAELLRHIAAHPDKFRFKALVADFIVRRHQLNADHPLVQNLFARPLPASPEADAPFSTLDCIFKERLTQPETPRTAHPVYDPMPDFADSTYGSYMDDIADLSAVFDCRWMFVRLNYVPEGCEAQREHYLEAGQRALRQYEALYRFYDAHGLSAKRLSGGDGKIIKDPVYPVDLTAEGLRFARTAHHWQDTKGAAKNPPDVKYLERKLKEMRAQEGA